ncbi:hypothetical protein M0657_003945 [Pyricularia oryzae]|nr:hypothetical protein M9X92_003307 [Pyricularia oryzae]KAI7925973.1 hypothetical protein M0657_003945 [Pyricularia oryzae]
MAPPSPTGPEPDKFCKTQCGKCHCYKAYMHAQHNVMDAQPWTEGWKATDICTVCHPYSDTCQTIPNTVQHGPGSFIFPIRCFTYNNYMTDDSCLL